MPTIAQNLYITQAFTAIDINASARTGIRVDCSGYANAAAVIQTNDVAAVVTYTFQRHTAASSGTTEVFDVLSTDAAKSTVWSKESTTDAATLTVDGWSRIAATSSSTSATTSGSSGFRIVEFNLDEIGLNASTAAIGATMRWISVDVDAPGAACIAWGIWILSGARYAKNGLSVTLP